jgi:hypothetical protein
VQANQLGVRLVLWAGIVPAPVPQSVLEAIEKLEIERSGDDVGGFQLTLRAEKTVGVEFDLLRSPQLLVGSRVVIGVLMGVTPEWLLDGVITHRELLPSDKPGSSRLCLTGRDLSAVMDRMDVVMSYPGCSDSVIAAAILVRYAPYGVVPQVSPTVDVPLPTERVPLQHETDLRCLRRLARDNNYVFFIEPLGFGASRAYFGPDLRFALPLSPLRVDMGARSNVDALTFKQDGDRAEFVEGRAYPPGFPVAVPIVGLPLPPVPPLAAIPTLPLHYRFDGSLTARSIPRALLAATGAQARANHRAVECEGTVDTVRYGSVMQPRRLVGVQGAGYSFDGYYSVSKVRHELSRHKYTQKFSLVREGVGSLTPAVM